jgi:hypothetical protein
MQSISDDGGEFQEQELGTLRCLNQTGKFLAVRGGDSADDAQSTQPMPGRLPQDYRLAVPCRLRRAFHRLGNERRFRTEIDKD